MVNFGGKQPNDKKQKILGEGEFDWQKSPRVGFFQVAAQINDTAAAFPLWFSDVTPKTSLLP